jgi:hypothetical protein
MSIQSEESRPASWPYLRMPEQVRTTGEWKMGMSAGGSMVIWPTKEPFPAKLHLIEAFRGTKEELERFQITFCRHGWEKDELHVHQNGDTWLFNWYSGTLAQVYIAGQCAKLLFDGQYDEAWAVGRGFRDAIQDAENGAVVDGQTRASGVKAG